MAKSSQPAFASGYAASSSSGRSATVTSSTPVGDRPSDGTAPRQTCSTWRSISSKPKRSANAREPAVVDVRADAVDARARRNVRAEPFEQRGADAVPTRLGEHARRDEAATRRVREPAEAAAGERAVELRKQRELLRPLAPAELLDRPCRLVREHDAADVQPRLDVGVALHHAQVDGHARSQTETCFVLSGVNGSRAQPPQRSRSRIPARRAIRSSSPGETERNGIEFRSQRPSTSVK